MSKSIWLQTLPFNQKGRDFVIGDLHGCVDELFLLLHHVSFDFRLDRLFSVGDLVDRGPKSMEALQLLDQPWFYSVRGNHEQMLIDHWKNPLEHPPYDQWIHLFPKEMVAKTLLKLESLPYVIRVGDSQQGYYVMHAELYCDQPLTNDLIDQALDHIESAQKKVLWSRHVVMGHLERNSQTQYHSPNLLPIFCGHSIVEVPLHLEQSFYIDTGAYVAYTEPMRSLVEHFGLSLINTQTKEHFFASTAQQYRGTVVNLGSLSY